MGRKKSHELIPYVDYVTDLGKLKAAQILAYSGYIPTADRAYKHKGRGRRGATMLAAKEAGCTLQTLYYWLEDENFRNLIMDMRQELCAMAVNCLHKQVQKGNAAVAMFLAERLAPEVFSKDYQRLAAEKEFEAIDVTPENKAPSIVINVSQSSPDYERNKIG